MARKLWLRSAVIVVAIAIPTGLGRAQDAAVTPPPPAAPLAAVPAPPPLPPGAVPGGTPDGRWYPYGPLEIQEVASANPPRRQPLRSVLRYFNVGCWSDINHTGCGNLKSECTFAFGSCHDFYKEQCEPCPPLPWSRNAPGRSQGCGCGD